jgi:hypothetical protein
METELEHLIGVKVKEVSSYQILFEDGTVIVLHPYETYVYTKEGSDK